MFCHLTHARHLLFYYNIKTLVWQCALVTLSWQAGRQGAYVLSHTVHLLMNWLSQDLCERLS